MTPCEPSTIESEDGHFDVVCSEHGHVFSYTCIDYKIRGEAALQAKVNEAWESHVKNPVLPAPVKPWLN